MWPAACDDHFVTTPTLRTTWLIHITRSRFQSTNTHTTRRSTRGSSRGSSRSSDSLESARLARSSRSVLPDDDAHSPSTTPLVIGVHLIEFEPKSTLHSGLRFLEIESFYFIGFLLLLIIIISGISSKIPRSLTTAAAHPLLRLPRRVRFGVGCRVVP